MTREDEVCEHLDTHEESEYHCNTCECYYYVCDSCGEEV